MGKIHVNLSVDEQIIKDAKKKSINLSNSAEKGILEGLRKTGVMIDEPLECEFCNIKGEKEKASDISVIKHFSKINNLIWIYPDEKWCCNKCLKIKCREVRGKINE